VTSIRPPDSRRELVSPVSHPVRLRVDDHDDLRVGAGLRGAVVARRAGPLRSVLSGSVLHRRRAGGLDPLPLARVNDGTGPRSGRVAEVDLTPQPPRSYRVQRPERRSIAGRDGLHPSDPADSAAKSDGRVVRGKPPGLTPRSQPSNV